MIGVWNLIIDYLIKTVHYILIIWFSIFFILNYRLVFFNYRTEFVNSHYPSWLPLCEISYNQCFAYIGYSLTHMAFKFFFRIYYQLSKIIFQIIVFYLIFKSKIYIPKNQCIFPFLAHPTFIWDFPWFWILNFRMAEYSLKY